MAAREGEDGLVLDSLRLASNAVDAGIQYDSRYPEMGEILGHGTSRDYTTRQLPVWQPFALKQAYTIPDAIFEQYNRTECFTQMGLLLELSRAYISVDNRLYTWNYMTGANFQAYEDLPHTITAVAFVRPRSDVFASNISGLIVLATTSEIYLLGVSAPGPTQDLIYYTTHMSVPTGGNGLVVERIVGTAQGRIFFTAKADSNVYEITYQKEEGWFRKRCAKVNRTGNPIDSFVPSFLAPDPKTRETISQMVMDDSRSLLYTLSSRSTLRCYYVSARGAASTFEACATYTYGSLMSHAQLVNASSSLLDPRATSIVAISVIPKSASRQIFLVAITSTGCRLFVRAARSGIVYPGGVDAPPNTMQVTHVRFPPAGSPGKDDKAQVGPFGPMVPVVAGVGGGVGTGFTRIGDMASPLSLNSGPLSRVFPCGSFVSVPQQGETDEMATQLFTAAPEIGRIALASQAKMSPLIMESANQVQVQGFVQDVAILGGTRYCQPNELARQIDSAPLTFVVLTNSGTYVISRRRPIEMLRSAIRSAVTRSTGAGDAELRQFIDMVGRVEGCAISLTLITGNVEENEGSDMMASTTTAKTATTDLARRCYVEYGGKPVIDENLLNVMGAREAPTLDSVRLSGRHDGLALYLARVLEPVWSRPCLQLAPRAGAPTKLYQSNLSPTALRLVQTSMIALLQFFDESKGYIEGLTGFDRIADANHSLEIAQQAEHRGMHALVVFIQRVVQAISFLQLLFEEDVKHLDETIYLLPEATRSRATTLTVRELVSTPAGQDQAKEIVNAIINRHIAAGANIDIISNALRERCGAFCSADDVLIYKATELVRKAKTHPDDDMGRAALLHESLRLFKQTARYLTAENLQEASDEYLDLNFHPGAIELALEFARAKDPDEYGLSYVKDGQPANDFRKSAYDTRVRCYTLVFGVLNEANELVLESQQPTQPSISDRELTATSGSARPSERLRDACYAVIHESRDELFHYCYYDWLISRGRAQQLLELNTVYVQAYLSRRTSHGGPGSLELADLLYQLYAKQQNFFEAARTLLALARSEAQSGERLTLQQRIMYLSMAKGYCGCYVPPHLRTALNELQLEIQEQLDVASIQDDLLAAVRADSSLHERQADLVKQLDTDGIMPLSTQFNVYADPLGYYEVCLAIFDSADYQDSALVQEYWVKLLTQKIHEGQDMSQGMERLVEAVRRAAMVFAASDVVFVVQDVLPLIERFRLANMPSADRFAPWIPQALLEANVSAELIFTVLDEMYDVRESPLGSSKMALAMLVSDIVFVLEEWYAAAAAVTGGGNGWDGRETIPTSRVKAALGKYAAADLGHGDAQQGVHARIHALQAQLV